MLSVLIAHSSSEPTTKVARRLAEMLSDEGYLVSYEPTDGSRPEPTGYDAVLVVPDLGADAVRTWATSNADALNGARSALVVVTDDAPDQARQAVDAFSETTEWSPKAAVQVSGMPKGSDYAVLVSWFAEGVARSSVAPSVTAEPRGRTTLTDLAAVEAELKASGASRPTRRFGV